MLREWKPDKALEDVCFDISIFWVQIKALPLEFMTKSNAEMIGNLFYKLVRCESTTRTNIIGSKYLRIQVEIDIHKPLQVGFFHEIGNGGRWISFKYERLPELCYRCGILGHLNRNCSATTPATHKILGDLYGLWLKAEVEAAILFNKGKFMRRVENQRNKHFDNFSTGINKDETNEEEEEKLQSDDETNGGRGEAVGMNTNETSCQQTAENSKVYLQTAEMEMSQTVEGVRSTKSKSKEQMSKPQEKLIVEEMDQVEIQETCHDSRKFAECSDVEKTVQYRGIVGRKRNVVPSPIPKGPNMHIDITNLSSQTDIDNSRPDSAQGKSPCTKKIRRSSDIISSPLIRSEAFPNSPNSPHLKLKERARRQGSNSPIIIKEGPSGANIAQDMKLNRICSSAEEAGLTMPPPQP